jgi:alpha-L-fucosidase
MKYNKTFKTLLILMVIGVNTQAQQQGKYQPTFESLEKVSPVPEWFKDAKFGIYFHWGVFSVPAFGNEWYPRNMYMKGSNENKHHLATYGTVEEWPYNNFITGAKDKKGNWVQFAPKLKSEGGSFDPDEWAQLFADAGAKFAGPVAEHHDGFSMWASKVNPWNSKDMGPKLDLAKLFTDAIRKRNMMVVLALHHAFNITGYYQAVPKTDDPKLQMLFGQQGKEKNEELWLAKHKEVIDMYKPDIIYQDFNLHLISQPVLLNFLSYYYNSAESWGKEVVATYKDGLNSKCALLDYERGGSSDITDYYWLTDDAISLTSWCYTEGLQYYSTKQILHGFIDRVSKNGNLLLNISPMSNGTIPQAQKDILHAMGSWLKKYGEGIYATRAWVKYGEGPTHMGAAHGVMGAPSEATAQDIRFTRSKDNTILYSILMGWDKGQKEAVINTLSSNRINLSKLKKIELILGEGKYLALNFKQKTEGLAISLPEKTTDDLAYVLKLSFEDVIPTFNRYADINCTPHYYLVPSDNNKNLVMGADLALTMKKKESSNQWKLESVGKGFYKIINCGNTTKVLEINTSTQSLSVSGNSGKDNQIWKIDESKNGLFKLYNKQYPALLLNVNTSINEGSKAEANTSGARSGFEWRLKEVCETKQSAYKPNTIPGTIEAEDYDNGCPEDVYNDKSESNEGGMYRLNDGVDIEKCSAGGYNVGWTNPGEWMAYTVNVSKNATYQVSFYVASPSDNAKIHIEVDGVDKTGVILLPSTGGYQSWGITKKTISLEAGQHVLKLVIDNGGFNIDKMIFDETK